MMFHVQAASRNHCALLAVVCGKIPVSEDQQQHPYPFPELVSSGRLEVQILKNPSIHEFQRSLESLEPNFLYLQGEQLPGSEEIGSLTWGGVDLSSAEALVELFGPTLPTTVYLETPNGEKLAKALHSKFMQPYVGCIPACPCIL